MRRRDRARLVLVAAGVLVAPPATFAEGGNRQPPAPSTSPAPELAAPAAARVAGAIARIAAFDLGELAEPDESDFRLAAQALALASSVSPDDQSILRRLIEAQTAAGDPAGAEASTRRLLALAPDDTMAQLRLISGRIARLQDADARLAAYAGFLGPRGEALDPSIRSRLALDAALLHRERGDMDGFAQLLSRAVALDATNKDAAAVALSFVAARLDDPAGRLDLLLALLNADPMDPATHLAIARELAGTGARAGAARFYATLRLALAGTSQEADDQVAAEIWTAQWLTGSAHELIAELQTELNRHRADVAREAEQRRASGGSGAPPTDLSGIGFAVPTARVVLAAAAAVGDPEQLAWALEEARRALRSAGESGAWRELAGVPADLPEDQAAGPREAWLARETFWAGLLGGAPPEELAPLAAALEQDASLGPALRARLLGWHQLRLGQTAAARTLLQAHADRDAWCAAGLARGSELDRDTTAATGAYAETARRFAGTTAGALARTRHLALTGEEPAPPPPAARLESIAQGVPGWLERLLADPRRVASLEFDLLTDTSGPEDPVLARVRLRNLSPMALALGPGRPIDSRLLVTPIIELGLARVPSTGMEEVVAADRRLRLLPQEAVEFTVRLDVGRLGFLLHDLATRSVRLRWRALQNFVVSQGRIFPGPMGLSNETRPHVRSAVPVTALDPAEVAGRLVSQRDTDFVDALVAASALLRIAASAPPASEGAPGTAPEPQKPDEPPADAAPEPPGRVVAPTVASTQVLADRLVGLYPGLPEPRRLAVLAVLPAAGRVPALAPLDDLARADAAPAIARLVLLSRVRTPDDPALARAAGSSDPELAELAALVSERLARTPAQRSFATSGGAAKAAPAAPEAAPPPAPVEPK
ncbi:MAG TPA: hypothetical protein VD963_08340 [Phycisphaerales bacterium]|nr:hypothetical protein [Phycisphaerales bacterium]